jgi:cation:H+ antiporter
MLLDFGLLALGLVVLYFGAEWLIRGASSIALGLGLRPLIVGLTVVALGTSLPEFVTNVLAALRRADDLAIGNILGSNIANIGLILGVAAVLMPLTVASSTLRREFPIMLGVQIAFYLLALDGVISRLDGGLLLAALAAFIGYLIRDARRRGMGPDDVVAAPELALPANKKAMLLAGGMVGLALGAHLMVGAAVNIAETFGVSPIVIGLTVVAIGTSLPELAATVVGVMRKETDLAVGNVIGSNLLNVLFVVGLVALLSPLRVDGEALQIHFPVMIGFCLLLLLAWRREALTRWHGILLLVAFAGFNAFVVVSAVM